jgi:hypothetical protein
MTDAGPGLRVDGPRDEVYIKYNSDRLVSRASATDSPAVIGQSRVVSGAAVKFVGAPGKFSARGVC